MSRSNQRTQTWTWSSCEGDVVVTVKVVSCAVCMNVKDPKDSRVGVLMLASLRCEHHGVRVCAGIDRILVPSHLARRIVNTHYLVLVRAVVLDADETDI